MYVGTYDGIGSLVCEDLICILRVRGQLISCRFGFIKEDACGAICRRPREVRRYVCEHIRRRTFAIAGADIANSFDVAASEKLAEARLVGRVGYCVGSGTAERIDNDVEREIWVGSDSDLSMVSTVRTSSTSMVRTKLSR